jgi:uncharacterized protein DUF1707/uncharacterized protein DUF4190
VALPLAAALPYEPEPQQLRASDADREVAVERLRTAAMEGRLDSDELESRLADAYSARWCSELTALTHDITPPPEPLTFVRPGGRLNTLAVVSLACGLLWMGWVGSVAAVITGHIALHQIGRSAGTEWGRGFALAGVCVGYFAIAALVFLLSFAL